MRRSVGLALVLPFLLGAFLACSAGNEAPDPSNSRSLLLIAVAANAAGALEDLAVLFEAQHPADVRLTFGSSGLLKAQIEEGAPYDLFFSADMARVEDLATKGLILSETVFPYAEGRLVAWARTDLPVKPTRLEDFNDPRFRNLRIAIANPETAPYGAAAREALRHVGAWDTFKDRIVVGSDIRQTYEFARTGNVDVCVTALTVLAAGDPAPLFEVPPNAHSPILQGTGMLARTEHEETGREFLDLIRSGEGQAILERHGYRLPARP